MRALFSFVLYRRHADSTCSDAACGTLVGEVTAATPTRLDQVATDVTSDWGFVCWNTKCPTGGTAAYSSCISTIAVPRTPISTELIPIPVSPVWFNVEPLGQVMDDNNVSESLTIRLPMCPVFPSMISEK